MRYNKFFAKFLILIAVFTVMFGDFSFKVSAQIQDGAYCVAECQVEPTSPECCNCLALSPNGKTLGCLAVSVANMAVYIFVPLIFMAVFVIFIYGLMNYIRQAGDQKKREEGVKYMIWGIVGLTVMVSVWGLVNILRSTAGLQEKQAPIPQMDFGGE